MTDAIDTTPRTTSGSRWGRATVGPYTLLITPEAVAVSVPRVTGNDLRSKLYRATLADLEGPVTGSGVLDRFITASSRCTISTVHHDEEGQRWIDVFLPPACRPRPALGRGQRRSPARVSHHQRDEPGGLRARRGTDG